MEEIIDPDDGEVILTKEMLDVVTLDDIALDEEFIRLPTDLSIWNAKYVKALQAFLMAKHSVELTKARLWLELKIEHKSDGQRGGPTEADLKAMLIVHDDYQEAALDQIDKESRKERLRRHVDGIVAKRDMLQMYGAKLRQEIKADLVVRD
jgi:hypothetical protein